MRSQTPDFKSLLFRVGFEQSDAVFELYPGIRAEAYRSSYALLYLADCCDKRVEDLPEIVRTIDRTVLEDMRKVELQEGGVIDAHVCFIVPEVVPYLAWAQSNERAVRNVSRKYWISSENPWEQLTNRLPFLPISESPTLNHADGLRLPDEDADWLDALISDGPTLTFAKFTRELQEQ